VLSPRFALDADRLTRFEREARLLAALDHPNIGSIYGIEDGALVLELVEGETLADRLLRGALPTAQALHIARQIAGALDAAHERGIIHRDLKPSVFSRGGKLCERITGRGDRSAISRASVRRGESNWRAPPVRAR
jgi:serine/threonine protein kinase